MQLRAKKYLQKWLRAKSNIFVTVDSVYIKNNFFFKLTHIYIIARKFKNLLIIKKKKSTISMFVNYKLQ